ncbi:MAG: class I SAM-dependent methyltransferase [Gemmatirosa sp.]
MEIHEAASLILGAVRARDAADPAMPRWADLGAGRGTFTEALARMLGQGAQVYAVDRDATAYAALLQLAGRRPNGARVIPSLADFADARAWDALGLRDLDGVLLANALHFVPAERQGQVLARVGAALRPGGRLVVVEYEGRAPSPWVPHPVSMARLQALVPSGWLRPRPVGARGSMFGGSIYAAAVERPAAPIAEPVPETAQDAEAP